MKIGDPTHPLWAALRLSAALLRITNLSLPVDKPAEQFVAHLRSETNRILLQAQEMATWSPTIANMPDVLAMARVLATQMNIVLHDPFAQRWAETMASATCVRALATEPRP